MVIVRPGKAISIMPGNQVASLQSNDRLRDKANLALGTVTCKRGKLINPGRHWRKYVFEGPLSNKALLGAGWADARPAI